MIPQIFVSCLCKANDQEVTPRVISDSEEINLTLCHCDSCRHSSGVLCTSYYPVEAPVITDNLKCFQRSGSTTRRYFCAICGCHLFRCWRKEDDKCEWDVSSGTVCTSRGIEVRFSSHISVADTKDGGASTWIRLSGSGSSEVQTAPCSSTRDATTVSIKGSVSEEETLTASCACGSVSFEITRPNQASYEATSAYPDLMYADKRHPASVKDNAGNEPWWIQGNDCDKFLAGTCACQSCRLASGFEIQTWAFIPRANIFFDRLLPQRDDHLPIPLDVAAVPEGVLSSYSSSAGVTRDFCSTCGATVFWRGDWRPELLDVSVGLFRAAGGARGEEWLRWWTDRVSFEEDTGTGRTGGAARAARTLITELEGGLKAWKGGRG